VLPVTGAAPTETALFTPASWVPVSGGKCAACQLAGSRLLIRAAMTAPSTAVPRVPPTCMAVDCRPPASPGPSESSSRNHELACTCRVPASSASGTSAAASEATAPSAVKMARSAPRDSATVIPVGQPSRTTT
jgi:hypothetical protein